MTSYRQVFFPPQSYILHADQYQGYIGGQFVSVLVPTPFLVGPTCGGHQRWTFKRASRARMNHPKDGCLRHQSSPQWALLPRELCSPTTAPLDSLASSPEATPLSSPMEIKTSGRSMLLNASPATTLVISHPALWRQQALLRNPKTYCVLP